MTMTVKVLLNETHGSMFWQYNEGDDLREALVFEAAEPACGRVEALLEIVWEQLNIDYPATEWAREYRARRNRSLSVGDVVVIGETAWTPLSMGWQQVTVRVEQVWFDMGTAQ